MVRFTKAPAIILAALFLASLVTTSAAAAQANSIEIGSNSGAVWTNLAPLNSPPARANHMMTYDSADDVAVMFGGWNGPYLGDTWIYSFQNNTWINKSPQASPSPRERGGVVYAAKHDEVILYGGFDGSKMLSETWIYNVAKNQWTQMVPSVSPPSSLNMVNLGMAYDSKDDVVVLFSNEGNTWVYDITQNTWINMQPSVSPNPRGLSTNGQQVVYDETSDTTLLFGGSPTWNFWLDPADSTATNDTWAYDYEANTWTNLQPQLAPYARFNSQMAVDSVDNVTVLYGGAPSGQTSLFNDTWIYNLVSNEWTNITPTRSPPVRYASVMAFSPLHGEAILFGGYDNLQGTFYGDTWAFKLSASAVPIPSASPSQSVTSLFFSVNSNSTVTDLAFNSTSCELCFTVTGPSGTAGYVQAQISKSLLGDTSNLKVYLDGKQLNYTAAAQQDFWIIYFTYHHSTHTVELVLGKTAQTPAPNYETEILAAIIIAGSIAIIGFILLFMKKSKNSTPGNSFSSKLKR
jgi:hypothetical protein